MGARSGPAGICHKQLPICHKSACEEWYLYPASVHISPNLDVYSSEQPLLYEDFQATLLRRQSGSS
jgi:hypothetical protein